MCGSRVEPIALRVAFECDLWVSQLSFVVRVVLWLLPFFCRQLCNGSSSDRIVGSKAERKAERIGFDLIRGEEHSSFSFFLASSSSCCFFLKKKKIKKKIQHPNNRRSYYFGSQFFFFFTVIFHFVVVFGSAACLHFCYLKIDRSIDLHTKRTKRQVTENKN